jgi:hypothetical protein
MAEQEKDELDRKKNTANEKLTVEVTGDGIKVDIPATIVTPPSDSKTVLGWTLGIIGVVSGIVVVTVSAPVGLALFAAGGGVAAAKYALSTDLQIRQDEGPGQLASP